MSNFGIALKGLMEENKLTGLDLMKKTRIHSSIISRWANGKQEFISTKHLIAMCQAVANNPRQGAELLIAHLKDECVGPAADLVEIGITSKRSALRESNERPYQTENERMFEFLRATAVKKPTVLKVLKNIAENEGFTK